MVSAWHPDCICVSAQIQFLLHLLHKFAACCSILYLPSSVPTCMQLQKLCCGGVTLSPVWYINSTILAVLRVFTYTDDCAVFVTAFIGHLLTVPRHQHFRALTLNSFVPYCLLYRVKHLWVCMQVKNLKPCLLPTTLVGWYVGMTRI